MERGELERRGIRCLECAVASLCQIFREAASLSYRKRLRFRRSMSHSGTIQGTFPQCSGGKNA